MRRPRLWVSGFVVCAAGLLALPSSNIVAAPPGNCPFSGCDADNVCPSQAFIIEFCHDFMGCGTPYWCFESAEECGGNRAVVICNGADQ